MEQLGLHFPPVDRQTKPLVRAETNPDPRVKQKASKRLARCEVD